MNFEYVNGIYDKLGQKLLLDVWMDKVAKEFLANSSDVMYIILFFFLFKLCICYLCIVLVYTYRYWQC